MGSHLFAALARPEVPDPWQFAQLPSGAAVPDVISTQNIDRQWCVASVDVRRALLLYLGGSWALGAGLVVVQFLPGGSPPWGAALLVLAGVLTTSVLIATRKTANPAAMFSRLSLWPTTFGWKLSPYDKRQRLAELSVVVRAIETGGFPVVRSKNRWFSRRWWLSDGTCVILRGPLPNRAGPDPAEVSIRTPPGGSLDYHRRFKGHVLSAIDAIVASQAPGNPVPALPADDRDS